MIISDAIQYIPFTHITRTQVAELLKKSPSTVDYYVGTGYKIVEGVRIKLQRQDNGTFLTKDVKEFIQTIK